MYRTRVAQRCPDNESRFERLSDNVLFLEFTILYAPNRKMGTARTTRRLETRTINSPTDARKAPETNSPILVPLPAAADASWLSPRKCPARITRRSEIRRTGMIICQTLTVYATQD